MRPLKAKHCVRIVGACVTVIVRRLKIKHYVGITGVCITVIAYVLSNADHHPFVYRMVVPKYSTSISTLKRMQEMNCTLENGDEGFREISEILKGYFQTTIGRKITRIKTLNQGVGVLETAEGKKMDQYIELQVSFSDEPPLTGKFYKLKSKIEETYLTSKLFAWKNGIFWAGIAMTLIAIFM